MERGREWERAAVREQWTRIERRQRAAKRLSRGVVLLLSGVVFVVFGLPSQACLMHGPWPHGCEAIVPRATRLLLLTGGSAAVLAGGWLSWSAFRE